MQLRYRQFLINEFEARRAKNKLYSQRAYARDLGLANSSFTRIMNGQRNLSPKKAVLIAQKIDLTASEAEIFITLVEIEYSRSPLIQTRAQKKLNNIYGQESFTPLDFETFRALTDWHYYAIFQLVDLPEFQPQPEWIAKRIGFSVEEVEKAVERLFKVGLLSVDTQTKKWVKNEKNVKLIAPMPAREIRHHHRQVLSRAEKALDQVDWKLRHFGASHFTIDQNKIDEFQKMIEKFHLELSQMIDRKSDKKEKVYTLSVAFFPLEEIS